MERKLAGVFFGIVIVVAVAFLVWSRQVLQMTISKKTA